MYYIRKFMCNNNGPDYEMYKDAKEIAHCQWLPIVTECLLNIAVNDFRCKEICLLWPGARCKWNPSVMQNVC